MASISVRLAEVGEVGEAPLQDPDLPCHGRASAAENLGVVEHRVRLDEGLLERDTRLADALAGVSHGPTRDGGLAARANHLADGDEEPGDARGEDREQDGGEAAQEDLHPELHLGGRGGSGCGDRGGELEHVRRHRRRLQRRARCGRGVRGDDDDARPAIAWETTLPRMKSRVSNAPRCGHDAGTGAREGRPSPGPKGREVPCGKSRAGLQARHEHLGPSPLPSALMCDTLL